MKPNFWLAFAVCLAGLVGLILLKGVAMNKLDQIMKRLDAIERVLEQMGPPYIQREYPGCLFNGINPNTNPVMGLACPCPRCSPR